MLTRMRAGDGRQWTAAVADCTSLRTLVLHGSMAALLPGGRCLDRLSTLRNLQQLTIAVPDDATVDVNSVLELQRRLGAVKVISVTESEAGVVPHFVFLPA